MIKEAEPARYQVLLHRVSIYNGGFFPPSFGAFYPCPVVSAVTTSLLVKEVIKTCVVAMQGKSSRRQQIYSVDKS